MLIASRIFAGKLRGDVVEIRFGLRPSDSRFESSHNPSVQIIALLDPVVSFDLLLVKDRKPNFRPEELLSSIEISGRHANYVVRLFVDSHRGAKNPRISVEPRLPAGIAENNYFGSVIAMFVARRQE